MSAAAVYSCPWCPLAYMDPTGGDDVEILHLFELHLDSHQSESARLAVTA